MALLIDPSGHEVEVKDPEAIEQRLANGWKLATETPKPAAKPKKDDAKK